MSRIERGRPFAERAIDPADAPKSRKSRPARSVTVNLEESPIDWLFSRDLTTRRQFDAGEQLRTD